VRVCVWGGGGGHGDAIAVQTDACVEGVATKCSHVIQAKHVWRHARVCSEAGACDREGGCETRKQACTWF
jgi:hypothetical protein